MIDRSDLRSAVVSVDWRFVAAWLATLTLIWTTYAFSHGAIVESMERDLTERIETDTLLLEDQASRTLDGVVSTMEAVAELSASLEPSERRKLSQSLKDLLFDDTVVRSLSLIDAQGYIVVSSNLSSLGQRAAKSVLESLGPLPLQPRKGVRFNSSLIQRDLTDLPAQQALAGTSQSIWLGQIDARHTSLVAHRWVVAINSGFFRNFWASAIRRDDVQVGLFSYVGQPLVTLGQGPAESPGLAQTIRDALLVREKGEISPDSLSSWIIRYRASARHAVAFVMLVDRTAQAQKHLDRTVVLRWSALGGSLVATIVIGLLYLSSRRYHRFAWANKLLLQQVHTDALTNVANRRAFDELVPQELTRAAALGLPLSLMTLDLDHFKAINDRFGHSSGDAVLKEMGKRWQMIVRANDLIARIGGEEFCVVLPGAGLKQAEAVALKLIEVTRREFVALPGVVPLLPVTVSIGLIGFDACPTDASLTSLLQTADEALYRAKENGRNQIVVASFDDKHGERPLFREIGKKKITPFADDDATAWLKGDFTAVSPSDRASR